MPKTKPWSWDRHFEDRYWALAASIACEVGRTLDASTDDAARDLVLLTERLQTSAEVPYDVRRQLADDVHNALEELAERAHRYARRILEAVPFEKRRS